MNNKIEITEILILTGKGSDKIGLGTKLPSGMYPYDELVFLEIRVAIGKGEEYVKTHFSGVPYTIKKIEHTEIKFSR